MRQSEPEPLARSYAVTHPAGTVVPPQPPGWDQLVYAASGVISVEAAEATWVTPSHRALWVPDGVQHRIRVAGRARLRNLYVRAGVLAVAGACRVIDVPPVLRELVLHAVARAPLWDNRPADSRLIAVIGDLLADVPVAPLHLPWPSDPAAATAARLLRADPGTPATLADIAHQAGASRRTLERRFRTETGLTLGQWRQRTRVLAAMPLLAAGRPVAAVAAAVGYSTPSAFTAAFRAVTGTLPSDHDL